MNIRYLEILEAIEQTGSFTGAAKKMHLTQSAISHAMAELEQQAGTALFERMSRGVYLTQCGVTLLEESRGILAACRSLEQRIGHLEEYTPIHIVSSITNATYLLPQFISNVRKKEPKIQIHVRVMSAAQAMRVLQSGEADIALIEGTEPQGAYRTILLDSYKLCAACAPGFSWMRQEMPARAAASPEQPDFLQEETSVAQECPDFSQEETSVAQECPDFSQEDALVVRECPDFSQEDASVAQEHLNLSQREALHQQERPLTVQDLCTYPLLLREPGSANRDTFDSMLALANQKAHPVWESVNSLALIKAAEAGLGITVLPDVLLSESIAANRLRPVKIEGIEMENKMFAVLHRDKYVTNPLRVVLETLREGTKTEKIGGTEEYR